MACSNLCKLFLLGNPSEPAVPTSGCRVGGHSFSSWCAHSEVLGWSLPMVFQYLDLLWGAAVSAESHTRLSRTHLLGTHH